MAPFGFPARMRERALAIARGDLSWTPPPARDSATVCLLRDTPSGVEVFLMRRVTSMAFAAGMHVYPGGAVEMSDSAVPIAGRADLGSVARRTSSVDPVALLVAAARETFEECGVLLAVDAAGEPARDDDALDSDREALCAGTRGFAEVLASRGLVVDDGAMVPLAHWVTPEVEDRRYDTRFFVTAVPAGQVARHLGGEADQAAWWSPAGALAESAAGRMAMLPPTLATLALLAEHGTAVEALEAAGHRAVAPLMPRPVLGADGELEWHLVHDRTGERLDGVSEPSASETDGVSGSS